MKRRIIIPLFVTLVVLAFSITPVNAEMPLLNRLHGNRIVPYPDGVEYTFSASEESYVAHGWDTRPPLYLNKNTWLELNGTERAEFLNSAVFRLYIDGSPIKLKRYQWYNTENKQMYIRYYTQFDANYFESGMTYEFTGEWYCEVYGVPYHIQYGFGPFFTAYVTFTP
jgi:hypothetical protein